MLTLTDQGPSRREFLRIGGLALGGLSLADLLAAKAFASTAGRPVTGKSVVFLFMQGGPSQIELFDPKMTAPPEIRSATGEVKTTVPGVTFGGTMEKLARQAHRLSVVRSFLTGNGNHDIKPLVSEETLGANLGSFYSRIAGMNHPANGMPTNALLFPRAVNPSAMPGNNKFGKFAATGPIGNAYAPFAPGAGGALQQDMTLQLPKDRVDDRRFLVKKLDQLKRDIDARGEFEGVEKFREQAFDTILGGVSGAFDISKEDPKVVERYDTSKLISPGKISRKWNNWKKYIDHGQSLGKLMLMARRLCEAGCGFVTVTTNFVWDMHADKNNATLDEGMRYVGAPFDHAVSAFIEDVHARGLSDRILLVCCGEMGRTPRINKRGGRDHWGKLAPLMLSGGGLQMGRVVGQSTRDAGEADTTPVTIRNLVSTIMHTLLDVGELRITDGVPDDVMRVAAGGEPIKELV